jgi:hypothetical protein
MIQSFQHSAELHLIQVMNVEVHRHYVHHWASSQGSEVISEVSLDSNDSNLKARSEYCNGERFFSLMQ